MTWKAQDIMSQRYEFCLLASLPDANISALCKSFRISRDTGYKWLSRFRGLGKKGLSDRSRRPYRSPNKTSSDIEEVIIRLRRKYPYWGPRKLRAFLFNKTGARSSLPSVSTFARILHRNGMVASAEPAPSWPAVGRFERSLPNELWQMDLKAAMRLSDRSKIYPVGLLDDHSRYLVGLWMIPDQTDSRVLQCWIDAAAANGLPESTLTDHGSQFRTEDHVSSAFRTYLWACGVSHTQGRYAHPQTQGKIERFWRTLNTEVLRRNNYHDLSSWQSCFDDWRYHYNTIRPHQELGDLPPIKRYRPSKRTFKPPDPKAKVGENDSEYRKVDTRGQIILAQQRIMIGRGYSGWTVECRFKENGCWHIYFHNNLVREHILTQPR